MANKWSDTRSVTAGVTSTSRPTHPNHPYRTIPGSQSLQSAGTLAGVMMIYIIVTVGRIGDITPALYSVPFAKIVAALAVIIALQNRPTLASTRVWSLAPARLTLLIMILVTASILFSVLRHATFNTIKGTALSVTVGLILMIKSATNWPAIKRLLFGCVLSAVVLAIQTELTRFAGRAGYTPDMDPNDFGFVFSGLLPIVVAFTVTTHGFKRLCFIGISIWVVLEILLTESRGGLLGLVSVVTVMVLLLPPHRKKHVAAQVTKATIARRIFVLTIGAFLAWHAIPQKARTRLASIDSIHHDYNLNLHDPTGRLTIWLQTLPLSLRRPWGWGAGAFDTVDGTYAHGRYKAAHNMYLQALIELGFIGLTLFLATIVSGLRRLLRESFTEPAPTDHEALERRLFARAMIASLTGICVSGFFLAELYSQVLWTLLILTCVVGRSPINSHNALQHEKAKP